jgi:cation:H+ antiporter
MLAVSIQAVLSLLVIAVASHVFVTQIEAVGVLMHLPPHLVALVLSPVATELPETMNALIWVRQGKERLALANISGAMMIQATVPSALAIFATPWLFDTALVVSGLMTMLAIIYLWQLFRRGNADGRALIPVVMFYVAFAAYAAWRFL